MTEHIDVFISSTSDDLRSYRARVVDAILALEAYPIDMKDFQPRKDNALQACYDEVQKAEIFVGIYAHRYGYSPGADVHFTDAAGKVHSGDGETSITAWEYQWAIERNIPLLLFVLADKDRDGEPILWPLTHIEDEPGRSRLKAFKEAILNRHVVKFFHSTDNLHALVTSALSNEIIGRIKRPSPQKFREQETLAQQMSTTPHPKSDTPKAGHFVGVLPRRYDDRPFHDRDTQRAEIVNTIKAGTPLITVIGRAGVGKTGLVSKVLGDLERDDDAPAGMVYLSAGTLASDTPTLDTVLARFAEILPDAQPLAEAQLDDAAKSAALLTALQGQRYVLLLDNLEPLQRHDGTLTATGLHTLIESVLELHTASLTILVTTRTPIKLPNTLKPYEKRIPLDSGLDPADAVAFLRGLDDGDLLPGDDAPLKTLIERTAGYPRALEATIGLLKTSTTLTLEDILEDKALFAGEVSAEIVSKAIDALPESFQRVMEGLALLGQAVEIAVLAYLLAPYMDTDNLRLILDQLVGRNFANFNRSTRRFSLHALDRDYALKRIPPGLIDDLNAEAPPYTQTTLNFRAAEYYKSIRLPEESWTSTSALAPQLNEFEYRMRLGDYDTAAELLTEFDSDYLLNWGEYTRMIDLHKRLDGKIKNSQLAQRSLSNLGTAYRHTGSLHNAIKCYDTALEIARTSEDRENEARWLSNLGTVYDDLGDTQNAIDHYQQALTINHEVNNQRGTGIALLNLGNSYRVLGEIQTGIDQYKEALAIFHEIGETYGASILLGDLGIAYSDLGQLQTAVDYYQQGLINNRQHDNRRGEAIVLSNLSDVYRKLNDVQNAIDYAQQSLAISREIGAKLIEGFALDNLGLALDLNGDYAGAVSNLEASIQVAKQLQSSDAAGWSLHCIAEVHLMNDHLNAAHTAIVEARDHDASGYDHGNLLYGVILKRLGKTDAANEAFTDAITAADALLAKTPNNYVAHYVGGLAYAGLALSENSQMASARANYEAALEVCDAAGVVKREARLLAALMQADGGEVLALLHNLLASHLDENK